MATAKPDVKAPDVAAAKSTASANAAGTKAASGAGAGASDAVVVDSKEVLEYLSTKLSADERVTVQRFRDFLRIPSMSSEGPKGSYHAAAKFLHSYAEEVGLETQTIELLPGLPIVIGTLKGRRPELPTVLLNSHYDVVPVYSEYWNWPPFGAAMDGDGNIYARGTQDMKCVCIMYLEAMRRLIAAAKAKGGKPLIERTIHLTFMPDEELGGNGMQPFIAQKWLTKEKLNVGVALDEGIANPTDKFTLFYGERALWWLHVKATGATGHASRFVQNTATEKLFRAVNHFLAFRAEQAALLNPPPAPATATAAPAATTATATAAAAPSKPAAETAATTAATAATAVTTATPPSHAHAHGSGCAHAAAKKLGDVVTLNLTMLRAGVTHNGGASYALNVVPSVAEAGFDVRIPPHVNLKHFEQQLAQWTAEDGVSIEWVIAADRHAVSSIETDPSKPNANAYYRTLLQSLAAQHLEVEPEIFPAATDGRFVRLEGIPVYGFSPIRRTPVLLHDHNEHLNARVLCDGVGVYQHIIPALANCIDNSA